MEHLQSLLDLLLHVDRHLYTLFAEYGVWTYALLFLIVFCETGLVVTPFLPGDSLLFAAGALAAGGGLSIHGLALLLFIAAVAGDSVNYATGRRIGPAVFGTRSRWLNGAHLERTHRFYERHGGKTIVLARFMPIIRTFAPFVAGVGRMDYGRFALFNVVGGAVWVATFLYAGYFFGNLPAVRRHFSLIIVAIVVVSLLPPAVAFARRRFGAPRATRPSF